MKFSAIFTCKEGNSYFSPFLPLRLIRKIAHRILGAFCRLCSGFPSKIELIFRLLLKITVEGSNTRSFKPIFVNPPSGRVRWMKIRISVLDFIPCITHSPVTYSEVGGLFELSVLTLYRGKLKYIQCLL